MKNLKIIYALIATCWVVLPQDTNAQQWLLTGNTLTTSARLGTNNNYPLDIRTSGFNRMYITSAAAGAARVGINTTAPGATLHVNGNSGSTSGRNFKVSYGAGGGLLNTEFSALAHLGTTLTGGNGWTALYAKNGAAACAGYFDGKVLVANGSVGVGLAAPTQKLHVHDGAIMVSGANAGGGAMVLFGDNNLAAHPFGRWGIEYVPNLGLNFWKPFTGGNNGANYHLLLKDDGKIGMGIDPASSANVFGGNFRLYVKDGILTEMVKIAGLNSTNWPDYVFAPGYRLKPLSEIEAFVKANKHLPNVPSAQEIEKNGLDVANMLTLQLEKIEELTLYLIEMKQEINTLKAENTSLKTAISNR